MFVSYYLSLQKLPNFSLMWSCLDDMNWHFGAHLNAFPLFKTFFLKPVILLYEKFLQFDWLRAVVFQFNLKYLHVKITNLLWVVV